MDEKTKKTQEMRAGGEHSEAARWRLRILGDSFESGGRRFSMDSEDTRIVFRIGYPARSAEKRGFPKTPGA